MKPQETSQIPADASLAAELSCDDVVEMANLTSGQTGVSGTIFISTAMGSHGPRAKYFLQPGRTQPSFSVSIADPPAVVANSLPARTVRQMAPHVIARIALNPTPSWISGITAIPGRSPRSMTSFKSFSAYEGEAEELR
jgi:hypothetical protein